MVSRAYAETIIWRRITQAIVWKSTTSSSANNTIKNNEAEKIIRSCGQETRRLWPGWPSSFPEHSTKVYCGEYDMFLNAAGEKVLLGNFPCHVNVWASDGTEELFAVGLINGGVAICTLVA